MVRRHKDFRLGIDIQVLLRNEKWKEINPVPEPTFWVGDGYTTYVMTPAFAITRGKLELTLRAEDTLHKIEQLGGWHVIYSEQRKHLAAKASI